MEIIAVVATTVLVTVPVLVVLAVVLAAVRADGYGRRPPDGPPSWSAGDLPSRPYRDAGR